MATTTIYNPLLKRNFQEVADTDAVEAEVETVEADVAELQQNKITKCNNAAQFANLQNDEIFQWQGNNGTNFVNGYFYKKTTSQITIASGTFYVNFQNDFITPLFTIPKGYYYYVENTTINYGNEIQKFFDNTLWISIQPCAIGNPITSVNGDVAYLTSVNDNYPVSDSLGRNWSNPMTLHSSGTFAKFKNYETGLELLLGLRDPVDIVSPIDFFAFLYNGLLYPIYYFGWAAIKTTSETSITEAVFTQIDAQPALENITNGADGSINIAADTNISGNLNVEGTQTVVHVEDIQSKNDYITLRADNPLALGANELSGITVNNYDGNNTDCILAVDANGWARVGDSSGQLEKLATIEETPTNGALLKYNSNTKELESDTRIFVELTKSFSATNFFMPARITASGNYVNFNILYPIPATATNINLQISKCILLYEQTLSLENTDTNSINLIPNLGLSIDIQLNTSRTAYSVCGVLLDFTLSFD